MKQASKVFEWLKQLPDWGKAISAVISAILGLIALFLSFRQNYYVFVFLVLPLSIIVIVAFCVFLIRNKTHSQLVGGKDFFTFGKPVRYSATTFLCLATIATIAYYTSETGRVAVDFALNGTSTPTSTFTSTPTSTSTGTSTSTSTFTFTPTLTPTPKEQGYYYLFVLDASATMIDEFDGRSRWDAGMDSMNVILEVLHDISNYGLIIVGGTDIIDTPDPCASRTGEDVSFTSKSDFKSRVGQVQPQGGGSYSAAFTLAVSRLRQLPDGTLKKMYFITGPSDACDKEEWDAIEIAATEIPSDLFSSIIIMDEESSYKPVEFAKRMKDRHKNLDVQVPNTNQSLQKASEKAINQTIINMHVHDTAVAPTPVAPTRTFTPSPTHTPANILTVFPTFTPTDTATPTPSFTPEPIIICPASSKPDFSSASFSGSATISTPLNCSTGHLPETAIFTNGSYSGIPDGTFIWVLVYPHGGLFYPQSPDACASPAPPPNQENGNWGVPTYLGKKNDPPKWFDIIVVVTDQSGSTFLSDHVHNGCATGDYTGISASELSQYNITEKGFITVQTQ